jgi:predicted rRNA methylase YqxC with S4 and FtsJ domains
MIAYARPGAIRKARIDAVLVSRGIAADRKAAAAMILAGDIFVRQVRDYFRCSKRVCFNDVVR